MYTLDFGLSLGASFAGLTDLRAQLVNTSGADVGAAVSSGFTDIGTGNYLWHYASFPDAHRGGVKFYSNADSSEILAFAAINPQEAEFTDAKTSSISSGGLDAAGVRAAVGLASANLDAQLGDLPTNSETAAALSAVVSTINAAIAALNNLSMANIRTAVGLASANLDSQLGDLPTNAELAAALAFLDVAVSSRLAPTVAARTLDVSAAGNAGVDWGNVENPGTSVALNATTIGQATILGAAGNQAIWDRLTSALTTSGSIGKLLVDTLNATILSRGVALTAAEVRAAIGLALANLDAQIAAIPEAAEAAWASGIMVDMPGAEPDITNKQGLHLAAAGTGANTTGMNTSTGRVRNLQNTDDLVTATLASGNRTVTDRNL